MPRKKQPPKVNAVLDFETDPFKYGRVPKPFTAGFYDGETFRHFWGPDCVRQLVEFLQDSPIEYRIYAHNGGKFDFFLMLEHVENPLKIINGRIVKAKLGRHELRDSYAIMPIPLAAYKKTEIDYGKFEPESREANRAEIVSYLRDDCVDLYRLVSAYWERFGDSLTIGSTAIKKLREYHPFDSQGASHDARFRPFYFGGRVEALERGELLGDWKVYDVNSMYPFVMSEYDHPTGSAYLTSYSSVMDKRGRMSGLADYPMYFAIIDCEQDGAFPQRQPGGPLNFRVPRGEFFVTSHELKAALVAGRVSNVKVRQVMAPKQVIRFKDYVSVYMAEKVAAKASKDKVAEIFAKLLLNSAYGKFGSNPENYFDWFVQGPYNEQPEDSCACADVNCPKHWRIYAKHGTSIHIWRKPTAAKRFFDVATAASVTGAARSVLLTALSSAERPIYCDTDSIICERLSAAMDDSRLGSWKLEASGDTCAIAGKKLYALRQGGNFVKTASKGVRLTGAQIQDIARGGVVHWENDSPTFSLTQSPRFVHRKIQSR